MIKFDNYKEDWNDGYYHISKDIHDYPDAWLYVIYSRRGPGKTYSGLLHPLTNDFQIAYMKRTKEDVNTIMKTTPLDYDNDKSPYKPINRDFNTTIYPKRIDNGIGSFYEVNQDGEYIGHPLSYILAFNALKLIKGIDLSDVEWMIVDEFIPLPGEVVRRDEGRQLLSLYMTINRDRQTRGRPPLKLILFSNAENISCPIISTLEIMDDIAEMETNGEGVRYIKKRKIFIRHIQEDEYPMSEEEKIGIFEGMQGTAWFDCAFGGSFSYNDFSNVQKLSMKRMVPRVMIFYHRKPYYIYQNPNNGMWYATRSQTNVSIPVYDLDLENDQKKFYTDWGIQLRINCINGLMKFETYTLYDLIINYKKIFTL